MCCATIGTRKTARHWYGLEKVLVAYTAILRFLHKEHLLSCEEEAKNALELGSQTP